jgi:hypothetical protein
MLVEGIHQRRRYHLAPNHSLEAESSSTRVGSSDQFERGGNIAPISQEQGARGVGRSETMDPTPSTGIPRLAAAQESLKRKKPHDGFEEEDSVRFSSLITIGWLNQLSAEFRIPTCLLCLRYRSDGDLTLRHRT